VPNGPKARVVTAAHRLIGASAVAGPVVPKWSKRRVVASAGHQIAAGQTLVFSLGIWLTVFEPAIPEQWVNAFSLVGGAGRQQLGLPCSRRWAIFHLAPPFVRQAGLL